MELRTSFRDSTKITRVCYHRPEEQSRLQFCVASLKLCERLRDEVPGLYEAMSQEATRGDFAGSLEC